MRTANNRSARPRGIPLCLAKDRRTRECGVSTTVCLFFRSACHLLIQVLVGSDFINDFRQEFPFHPSFPQWFKQHGYTTLGHSKLYHPSHPLNFDEPLSWSQDAANGTDTGVRVGAIAGYPAYHRDSGKSRGCGYFDVCPTIDPSRDQFVDHHTATEVIATMNMVVKAQRPRPFFLGVGMIRPHLPFIVP